MRPQNHWKSVTYRTNQEWVYRTKISDVNELKRRINSEWANLTLHISQGSASTYFRWSEHFRVNFVKGLFLGNPSNFYFNTRANDFGRIGIASVSMRILVKAAEWCKGSRIRLYCTNKQQYCYLWQKARFVFSKKEQTIEVRTGTNLERHSWYFAQNSLCVSNATVQTYEYLRRCSRGRSCHSRRHPSCTRVRSSVYRKSDNRASCSDARNPRWSSRLYSVTVHRR